MVALLQSEFQIDEHETRGLRVLIVDRALEDLLAEGLVVRTHLLQREYEGVHDVLAAQRVVRAVDGADDADEPGTNVRRFRILHDVAAHIERHERAQDLGELVLIELQFIGLDEQEQQQRIGLRRFQLLETLQ